MCVKKWKLSSILIIIVSFLIILSPTLFSISPVSTPYNHSKWKKLSVKVTFIGNSGFIVEAGEKKIAVDAMFKGFPGRYTLPADVINKMKNLKPPFNNIDLILATHLHADHLKTEYVSYYLVKNKKAEFITTAETIKIMENSLPEFFQYSNRVLGVNPGLGDQNKLENNGIKITAFGMPHGSNPVQHNCLIFETSGKKIIHLGDMSGEKVKNIFKSVGIENKNIDIAFVPYWYLTTSANADLIKKFIKAKIIIAVHLSLKGRNEKISNIENNIRSHFPSVIIFWKELQSKVFLL